MKNSLLDILRRISEIIADNEDYAIVLDTIVQELAESLGVDVCSIYVFNQKTEKLILAATHGLHRKAVGRVRMKSGEGLTGFSFQTRTMLNLKNPEQHPQFLYFKNTGEEKYKSFLSAPLNIGRKCVGILVIQRVKAESFSKDVINMVTSLSTQLANLIVNADMLRELEKTASESVALPKKSRAQIILRGKAANSGMAIGRVFCYESENDFNKVSHGTNKNTTRELEIFEQAVTITKQKTIKLSQRALSMVSEFDASVFDAHLLFLEDQFLLGKIKDEISKRKHSAEFSLKLIYQEFENKFKTLEQQIFRDKIMDFKDVMLRLLETIRIIKQGKRNSKSFKLDEKNVILVAKELLPSVLIRMPVNNFVGIICEKGGVTAHVAMLAKALDIPALMGVKGAWNAARNNKQIIMDCHSEIVYINPRKQVIQNYQKLLAKDANKRKQEIDAEPAVMSDGNEVHLNANISLLCETSLLNDYGVKGVGLYRTEFLYMIRDRLPSEEEIYRVFSKIMQKSREEGTIRLLDVGGDKRLPYIEFANEDNPALGQRGIRFLIEHPELLKTQLKAILRAGVFGNLNIMLPMVSGAHEIIAFRHFLDEVEQELHHNNIEHTDKFRLGIMLEIPSAVFDIESLIKEVDFMSIGSNDLVQYIFATDRGNDAVSGQYQALHPVFLRILHRIGETFKEYPGKSLSICGEMAGHPFAVPFIIGCGIKSMSMAPMQIQQVKKCIRAFNMDECNKLLKQSLTLREPEEVLNLVKNTFESKNLPMN